VECQAIKTFEAPPLFVNEIAVIFGKGLSDVDEQFQLLTEHMIWLPSSKCQLERFKVSLRCDDTFHPLLISNGHSRKGDAVSLDIAVGNSLGNIPTEGGAMKCGSFTAKL